MAVDTQEVTQQAQPDGTRAEYGRVWYQGRKVSAKTYAAATGGAPPAAQPAAEGEHLPPASGLLNDFADFARILGDADASQRRRDEAIDGIEGLLSKLTPGDYPELADHPVVTRFMEEIAKRRERQGERVPGQVFGEGLAQQDVPWRMEDVLKRATDPSHPDFETFKLIEYTFSETVYLGWNGLGIWAIADVPLRIPKVFLDVYQESRRQKMAAKQHADFLFAPRGRTGNAGPDGVPADPTIMAGPGGVTSRMLRGQFAGGLFEPGAGMDVVVPDGDRPGFEPGEEGGEGDAAA